MSDTVEFTILEADATTEVDTVTAVIDSTVADMVSGDSTWTLDVGLESAQRGALAVKGRVVRAQYADDYPFWGVIESNDQTTLTEDHSSVPRQVSVGGRDLLAQWADARVQQWPGMEQVDYQTRHFNYASPGKVSRISGTVYDHGLVLDYDSNGQPNQPDRPPPVTWRDRSARRIWGRAFTLDMPGGTWLLRTTVTPTSNVILRQHGTADDRLLVWVGGVPVLTTPDAPQWVWGDTWPSLTELQAGVTYDVVCRCENEYTEPGGSAAWMALTGWLLPDQASPLTSSLVAYRSQVSGWSALEVLTGPTPGWTPVEVLRVLLAEWQEAGQLTGWYVVDMDEFVEVGWAETEEISFDVDSQTGYDVLAQLRDGLCEIRAYVVGDQKQLLVYPPGTMGDFHTGAPGVEPTSRELKAHSARWVDG